LKKFHFNLEALLSLRESRRDSCRQLLAQLLNDENNLIENKAEVLRKKEASLQAIKEVSSTGVVDLNKISNNRYYINQLVNESLLFDQKIENLNNQISLCRKALVKADQEVKVLDKLKEKQRTLFLEAEAKAEARELEETWLATHLSGGKE
jgi:flagellar protein FliJ